MLSTLTSNCSLCHLHILSTRVQITRNLYCVFQATGQRSQALSHVDDTYRSVLQTTPAYRALAAALLALLLTGCEARVSVDLAASGHGSTDEVNLAIDGVDLLDEDGSNHELDRDGDDDTVSGRAQAFEFKGAAACDSCGATSGTFTVKGVTLTYSATTEFRDGLGGTTLNGKVVEVQSVAEVTSTGTTYRATRIELDD